MLEPALAPEKGGAPRSGEDRRKHCPGWRKYEQNNVSIKIQTNTEDCGMGRRENRSI